MLFKELAIKYSRIANKIKNSVSNKRPQPGFEPGPSARGRRSAAELSRLIFSERFIL